MLEATFNAWYPVYTFQEYSLKNFQRKSKFSLRTLLVHEKRKLGPNKSFSEDFLNLLIEEKTSMKIFYYTLNAIVYVM